MNSIEVVSNPEKKAPQQAVDGPVLRVFIKEGSPTAHREAETAKAHRG